MSDQDPEKIDLIEFKYHAISNRSQRIETVRSSRRGNELPPHITRHTESPGTTYRPADLSCGRIDVINKLLAVVCRALPHGRYPLLLSHRERNKIFHHGELHKSPHWMGLIIAGGSPSRGDRSLALPGTYCQPSLGQVRRAKGVYVPLRASSPSAPCSFLCPPCRDARNDARSSTMTA